MNLNRHSRIINKIIILFLIAAVLTGCGKETRRTDYVARVNNSYLTEKDIEKIITSSPGKNFYRNEIIRNWINREVLFQKAVEEGIIDEQEYKRIIDDSRKELAASMLLNQVYNQKEITAADEELNEFYNLHKEEFRLNENHYLLNRADFRNEETAVSFRTAVMENSWDEALEEFSESNKAGHKVTSDFFAESELHPSALLRIVQELHPGEISIVINGSPEVFTIVQMLQRYGEGTIPPREVIKGTLERRLIKKKKDELIQNYIKELYSDSEIEVKQD